MSATPQDTPAMPYLEGWPNTQDDPRPLTEAEAFALMFAGRDFSTQTQEQFFAVWALQGMHRTNAPDWFGVREGDIALAAEFAQAFLKFRANRFSPIGAQDCAAVVGLAGFFAAIPSSDYPKKCRPSVEDVAALCFSFARRVVGAGQSLPATTTEAAAND